MWGPLESAKALLALRLGCRFRTTRRFCRFDVALRAISSQSSYESRCRWCLAEPLLTCLNP